MTSIAHSHALLIPAGDRLPDLVTHLDRRVELGASRGQLTPPAQEVPAQPVVPGEEVGGVEWCGAVSQHLEVGQHERLVLCRPARRRHHLAAVQNRPVIADPGAELDAPLETGSGLQRDP